jgi:hypothetical protein
MDKLPFGGAAFARPGKRRRRGAAAAASAPRPVAEPARAPRGDRVPALAKHAIAASAVLGILAWVRFSGPLPWSYDEYYHLALAREMRSGLRLETFPWAPFSVLFERFVDGSPLFHLVLVPLAGLPIERAARIGAVLGQAFLVASFAWALWSLRVPRPWWFLLAIPALGTLFLQRLEMCRPHVWLIGFSVLVLALLVERRWWALFMATALFGLTHVGGWIAVPMAAVWALSAPLARGERDARGRPGGAGAAGGALGRLAGLGWQGVAATACGWLLGQLLHPGVPDNFRLLWMSNVVIPFEASAGSDEALQSQLGLELAPPELDLVLRQWPAFVAPLLVIAQLLLVPRLRTRATLTTGAVALAFFTVGCLLIRRFLELGAPLALLALAVVVRERRAQGMPPLFGSAGRPLAALAIAIGALWSVGMLRSYGFGRTSAPHEMARWLGEHGAEGERVFTAQWADSAPLFWFAPQLQSLVALDPTAFHTRHPRLFAEYVRIAHGYHQEPVRSIRERFGARWVSVWKAPVYQPLAGQLLRSAGARVVHDDREYLVFDLGPPPKSAPPSALAGGAPESAR